MKRLVLSTCVVLLAAAAQSAQAQIKLPVFDPEQDIQGAKEVAFKPANQARDFRHGALLAITMNDKDQTRVTGTLVRVDRKNRQLFIRTEPGAMPVAVAEKDIKAVDKGVYAIRPAGTADDLVVQPEIQKIVIYNGTVPTVSYVGNTLSPGERSYLQSAEEAENEVMRLQNMADTRAGVFDREVAIQAERLRSSTLLNHMVRRQLFELASIAPPIQWGNAFYRNGLFGSNNAPYYATPGVLGVMSSSSNILNVSHDQKDLLPIAMPTAKDNADLRQARENLAAAQNRLLYEDGRVVAVMFKE